jgi:hypothetical protein
MPGLVAKYIIRPSLHQKKMRIYHQLNFLAIWGFCEGGPYFKAGAILIPNSLLALHALPLSDGLILGYLEYKDKYVIPAKPNTIHPYKTYHKFASTAQRTSTGSLRFYTLSHLTPRTYLRIMKFSQAV